MEKIKTDASSQAFMQAGPTLSLSRRDCLLGVEENQPILDCIRGFMEEYHIAPYEEETHKGLVRHVLIRKGFTTEN